MSRKSPRLRAQVFGLPVCAGWFICQGLGAQVGEREEAWMPALSGGKFSGLDIVALSRHASFCFDIQYCVTVSGLPKMDQYLKISGLGFAMLGG